VGWIFQNLVTNAVKFNTYPHKCVELGWQPAPLPCSDGGGAGGGGVQAYEFFVRDNGIGIDPRYHERIFRVFERLHTKEEYEGTGVGLAIVKKAASKLGGSVRVESKPGEGSTFFVTLSNEYEETVR
jgi:light-regulated signal transduction histidine kinase (bacteriophytochrome)